MNILIIGGTGTLGNELTRQILGNHNEVLKGNVSYIKKFLNNPPFITIFSRDELKQQEMKKRFGNDSRLDFALGDIRDYKRVEEVMWGKNIVFHVAALKHVDVLEENPTESVKTNILGTMNVCMAAKRQNVGSVIFSSTDKAVDPINTYGFCKAISERIILSQSIGEDINFKVFRWGNVIGSRGSAIHYFAKTLKEEGRVYLTDTRMTRFWIRIEDAVKFMLENYNKIGDIMIPKMKAAPILDIACATAKVVGVDDFEIVTTGLRAGEKIHEVLESQHSKNCISSKDCVNHSLEDLKTMIKEALCL